MGWQMQARSAGALRDDERFPMRYVLQDFFTERTLQIIYTLMDEYSELAQFIWGDGGYELRRWGILELIRWYASQLDCDHTTNGILSELCQLYAHYPEVANEFQDMRVIL